MTDNSTLETSAKKFLWPRYAGPEDLAVIESVPLAARGLPESTYALLVRAATLRPEHNAFTVLPDAARWREPLRRSYGELLADVHRYANLLHELGVRRTDAVALIAPNCAQLIPATLAAQAAGIAAPIETVTILGALPVTDVGKPYKLGLRADATRRELLDALAEICGVAGIAAAVEDGAIVATVALDADADRTATETILGRYAINWKVEVR